MGTASSGRSQPCSESTDGIANANLTSARAPTAAERSRADAADDGRDSPCAIAQHHETRSEADDHPEAPAPEADGPTSTEGTTPEGFPAQWRRTRRPAPEARRTRRPRKGRPW